MTDSKLLVKAHHSYSKSKPDELDLSPGDIVQVTNDEHASWWVGYNETTKESGWFPSNFVTKTESKAKPKARKLVLITKRYEAADEDELTLEAGDVVKVKDDVDGWYLGRFNGITGRFPASHAEDYTPAESGVRPLPQPPASSAQPAPAPPTLPARSPPLPRRAQTEIAQSERFNDVLNAPTSPLSDEDLDAAQREKKAGHRISRLFGSKKSRSKDGASDAEPMSPADPAARDEDLRENIASPSRPLPLPSIASPPPPAARAVPPTPLASIGKPPSIPAPAAPPSARAVPPLPPTGLGKPPPIPAPATPAAPQPMALPRRPSASSGGESPAPVPPPPLPLIATAAAAAEDVEDGSRPTAEPQSEANPADGDEQQAAADGEAAEKTRAPAKLAKVLEDYEAQSPEELNLMQGDVVTIISRGGDDDPRWKGEYHGKKGYFPGSVVEPIEDSAALDEEDGDGSARPRGGFKLAAYGVQQGGLGSIFAGTGGMPALRKSAPRKADDAEPAQEAPTLAAAPVMPRLRSVQRPAPKEQPREEEPPNFLAHLAKVPRRLAASASSDDVGASPQPAPAPAAPLRNTHPADAVPDPDAGDEDGDEQAQDGDAVPAPAPRAVPEVSDSAADADADADAVAPVPARTADAGSDADEASADEDTADVARAPYEPVKAPSLPQVKRLVRRGPRQMPTSEGLKSNTSESQSQSLQSALKRDKDLEPAQPPPPPTPPPVAEKPKGFSRASQFGGPQLPTGGFKASSRVGSAMASRLAALQAQAGGGDEDAPPARAPRDATSPPPVAQKPPLASHAQPEAALAGSQPPPPAAAPAAEWQKKTEDELARLRSDAERARRSEEQVEQVVARLAASERESQAHKQTVASLERQVESLAAQLAALSTDISGIQRSVAGLASSSGVSSSEVASIVRTELRGALDPIHKHNQELQDESKKLDKKIADLRTYVDELVVDEEE
ncbi:hypothetical protein LPJ61_002368 [Coemansia biformis]|uniref:SH3 domain-containing protein n=1 Tax=Coemansia biformis TaxID=1286918 RepID=A0A9W7YCL7_9FUNG|nr:hypothetical protein LPJ61_002368 [Coemansia biformis]